MRLCRLQPRLQMVLSLAVLVGPPCVAGGVREAAKPHATGLQALRNVLRGGKLPMSASGGSDAPPGPSTVPQQPCVFALVGDGNLAELSNGYVFVLLDLQKPALRCLRGDFGGGGRWGNNLLHSRGFVLETEGPDGALFSSGEHGHEAKPRYTVTHDDDKIVLELFDVVDNVQSPLVREAWRVTLRRGERAFTLRLSGAVVTEGASVRSIRHSLFTTRSSLYALYDGGVVQVRTIICSRVAAIVNCGY